MSAAPPTRFRLIELLVVVGLLALLAAIIAPAILAAREAARRLQCGNNLKQLSLGALNYGDVYLRFPFGTSGSRSLPPESRFSWYPGLWPFIEGKPPTLLVDQNQAWDAEINRAPQVEYVIYDFPDMTNPRTEVRPLPRLGLVSCPSASSEEKVLGIQVTHYVGMAGLGVQSPALDETQPGIGIWGYDRQLSKDKLQDGASSTILLIETSREPGPWIAGGRPTVCGVDLASEPLFGAHRQFGGLHSTCPVVMADVSIRQLNEAMDTAVFAALVTVAGKD